MQASKHMPKQAHMNSYMVLSVFPAISWRTGDKVMHHMWFFYMLRVKMVYNFESDDDCTNSMMDKLN
jgi:hypothetical protein